MLFHFSLKPRLQHFICLQRFYLIWEGIKSNEWVMKLIWGIWSILRFGLHLIKYHEWFVRDAHNIRFSLSIDGFNPFKNIAKLYSIWLVILMSHNLLLWLCMKKQFFITSLIISNPKSPKMKLMFTYKLVDKLNDLWKNRVSTYDAFTFETFR